MDRLYFQDGELLSFSARVLAEKSGKQGWSYLLDRSAFYPGGGGQPADRGTLDGVPVTGLREQNGEVWHKLSQRLPEDVREVQGEVDARWRHEYQQQHSGQHLLSALLFQHGADTVSIRLGSELVSIELAGQWLDRDQILAIENEANQLIVQRRFIKGYFPTENELGNLSLRRESKVDENVRVVEIEGVDCTPCGGVHCAHLGEVGLVRFFSEEKIRGHQRLHWLVGERAHRHHRECLRWLDRAGTVLAVPAERVAERCEQLLREQAELQQQLRVCERELAQALLDRAKGRVLVLASEEEGGGAGPADAEGTVRIRAGFRVCGELARALAHSGSSALVLCDDGKGATRWFCCSADVARGQAVVQDLKKLGGRGGGKAPLWQGGLPSRPTVEQAQAVASQLVLVKT